MFNNVPIKFKYVLTIYVVFTSITLAKSVINIYQKELTHFWKIVLFSPIQFLLIALSIPIINWLIKLYPVHKTPIKFLIPHLTISLIYAVIITFVKDILILLFIYVADNTIFEVSVSEYYDNIFMNLLGINLVNVIMYWAILSYFFVVDYNKKYVEKNKKLIEAENLLSRAELIALKMQLRPHFFFNTLHSISSLMEKNVKQAQDVLGRLGDLLRYSLSFQSKNFVPIGEEILFIENYLEIEATRFNDKLIIEIDIENEIMNAAIPSFLLQPIVENSLKHGFSNRTEDCHLMIKGYKEKENVCLRIDDNGEGQKGNSELGIGLSNTINRLNQIYKDNYSIDFGNNQNLGYYFEIKIPYKEYRESMDEED